MRKISESNEASSVSQTLNSPLAKFIQASPYFWLRPFAGLKTASRGRSTREGSKFSSVKVPGETMRTILRSTGPLLVAGSPICSQIATDSPRATKRAKYCSIACTGTPAIGIGSPFEVPRLVKVKLSILAVRTASSKNIS